MAFINVHLSFVGLSKMASLYPFLSNCKGYFQIQVLEHVSLVSAKNHSSRIDSLVLILVYCHFPKQHNSFFKPSKMVKLANLTELRDRKCKRPVDFLP